MVMLPAGGGHRSSRGRCLRHLIIVLFATIVCILGVVVWRLGDLSASVSGGSAKRRGIFSRRKASLMNEDESMNVLKSEAIWQTAQDDPLFGATGAAVNNKNKKKASLLAAASDRKRKHHKREVDEKGGTTMASSQQPFENAILEAVGVASPERYLTEAQFGAGGNQFFKEVVSGEIPFHPYASVNAVVWGDTAPNPFQRKTIQTPFKTVYFNYTDDELLHMHHDVDIVISWVNGSAIDHRWRKYALDNFPEELRTRRHGGWFPTQPVVEKRNGASVKVDWQLNKLGILEAYLNGGDGTKLMSVMDREHDELRYLLRSVQKNMQWHCGRLIIVSPGQTPSWMNRARNFFLRSKGQSVPQQPRQQTRKDEGEETPVLQKCRNSISRRIVVVHQDAAIPSAVRLTFNTNTIEAHLHRIRGLGNLYVHLNDDYLITRPTKVTDFVNSRGGPVLNFESGRVVTSIGQTRIAGRSIWESSVTHTNGFVEEVFAHGINNDQDEFRRAAERSYDSGRRSGSSSRRPVYLGEDIAKWDHDGEEPDVHFAVSDLRNPPDTAWPRPRYYLKHAPFVVCRNMYKRHLHRFYGHRFTTAELEHRYRDVQDYVPPQIHNAFVTDVPWAGSRKYTPFHMPLSMRRAADSDALASAVLAAATTTAKSPGSLDDVSLGTVGTRSDAERLLHRSSLSSDPTTTIYLDNEDGCAPALLRIGPSAAGHVIPLTNDMKKNRRLFGLIDSINPIFLTINDNGYDSKDVEDLLVNFTGRAFPFPSVAEHPDEMFYGLQRAPHLLTGGGAGGDDGQQLAHIEEFGFSLHRKQAMEQHQKKKGADWRDDSDLVEAPELLNSILGTGSAEVANDASTRSRWSLHGPASSMPETQREILGLSATSSLEDTVLYTVLPQEQLHYERRYEYFNKLPLLVSLLPDVDELVVCGLLRSIRHLALPDFEGKVFVYRENLKNVAGGITAQGSTPYEFRPVLLCTEYNRSLVQFLPSLTTAESIFKKLSAERPKQLFSSLSSEVDGLLGSVDALVLRIPCNTILGQSLALEDFEVKHFAGGMKSLFLQAPCPSAPSFKSLKDKSVAVNWIHGSTPTVLIQSFPLPDRFYEPNDVLTYGY